MERDVDAKEQTANQLLLISAKNAMLDYAFHTLPHTTQIRSHKK